MTYLRKTHSAIDLHAFNNSFSIFFLNQIIELKCRWPVVAQTTFSLQLLYYVCDMSPYIRHQPGFMHLLKIPAALLETLFANSLLGLY